MRLFDDVIYIRNISIKLPLICSNIFILNECVWVTVCYSFTDILSRSALHDWISRDFHIETAEWHTQKSQTKQNPMRTTTNNIFVPAYLTLATVF